MSKSNKNKLNSEKLISRIKTLINSDKKELIKSYSKPNLWSIIYNKRDGSADEKAYSRFLAWLLHPKESHGLEDKFANKLIEYLATIDEVKKDKKRYLPDSTPIKKSKVAHCNTEALGQSIDILYRNDEAGRAIIIENKTGTELHLSNNGLEKKKDYTSGSYCQLEKYFNVVNGNWDTYGIKIADQHIEDAEAVIGLPKIYIFLHPEGITPAESIERNTKVLNAVKKGEIDKGNQDWEKSNWILPWISISYEDINNVLDELINENIEEDTEKLINEFINDSKRQFDPTCKREVKKEIFGEKAGNIQEDTGVILSEVMAAIKVLNIDIVEDNLDGAYDEVNKKLLKPDFKQNLSNFELELEEKFKDSKLGVNKKDAEYVLRYLWNLKPKPNEENKEVQKLMQKLFDYFTNDNWNDKSEDWTKIKSGAIAEIREDLQLEYGIKYISRTSAPGHALYIFTDKSSNNEKNIYKDLTWNNANECYYICGNSHGIVPSEVCFSKRENEKRTIKSYKKTLKKKNASEWLISFNDFITGVESILNPKMR